MPETPLGSGDLTNLAAQSGKLASLLRPSMALPDTALVADMEAIVANLVNKNSWCILICAFFGMQLVHDVAAERSICVRQ